MTQTAFDNFTRGNANPINGYWSKPTGVGTANQLTSNLVEQGDAVNGEHSTYMNLWSGGNDQWSEVTVGAFSSSAQLGPCVRMSTSANTFYCLNLIAGTSTSSLLANVAGSYGTVATVTVSATTGDKIALGVIGTTLSVYKNGVFVNSYTDSNISSGVPGFRINALGTPANGQITQWRGGTGNMSALMPTFSVASGVYSAAQTVTITGQSGSTIYYTLNGTTPTHASPSIPSGGTVTVSTTSMLSAISSIAGLDDSGVSTAGYTINFNTWTPKGQLSGFATIAGQPNVLYEANPQILSANPDGKIFKMWYGAGAAVGINYAESSDGLTWTQYSSNPVVANQVANKIFHSGSTYYLYTSSSFTSGTINVYTSSNGISFSLAKANALVANGTYEGNGLAQLAVVDQIAGTWYAWYDFIGNGSTTVWGNAQATSTDLINWTKTGVYTTGLAGTFAGNVEFHKIGSTYYGWTMTAGPHLNNNILVRYSGASAATGGSGWTLPTLNGGTCPVTYYPNTAAELATYGLATQIADPSLCEYNGNTYMYFSLGTGNSANFNLFCAVAYGFTMANLVKTYEGALNAPDPTYVLPGTGTTPVQDSFKYNLVTLGSDNFTRANANPISGNWVQLSHVTYSAAQIVSNLATVQNAGGSGDSWYSGVNWGPDQWAAAKVSTCTANGYFGVILRANMDDVGNGYRILWNGASGLGHSGSLFIQRSKDGTFVTLASQTITMSAGDTLMGAIIGSNIYCYWNGFLVLSATDSGLTFGAAGFSVVGNASTDVGISAWSGGMFQANPLIVPALGSGYSVPDCRNYGSFPNASRVLQGTLIYDVQTSDNPAVPGVDSRAAGAPADCRVSPNIPQNSRTPGTFGPGE